MVTIVILITKDNLTNKILNELFKGKDYTCSPFLLATKFGVFTYTITKTSAGDFMY